MLKMYGFFYKIKELFWGEQSRWPLWTPVLFSVGIGVYFLLPKEPSMWWSLIIFEAVLVTAWFCRLRPLVLFILGVAAVIIIGFMDIQLQSIYRAKHIDLIADKTDYVAGRIVKIEHSYKGQQRLVLEDVRDFDGKPARGLIKVTQRFEDKSLYPGQCVEMAAHLMSLPKPAIVGGYQFDRKAFFAGVAGNGYSVSSILPIDCEQKLSLGAVLGQLTTELRQKIVKRIQAVLPADEAGIVSAIMAGERGGIRKEITNHYRDAGLAHFLSISGLHMSMLAGLMFFFIRLLVALIPPLALRWDSKKAAAIFAIVLSAFYLMISGAEVPTQRAFIMTFVVLLGVLMSRRAISMRTISLAALIILVISPQALIGASFQMSFAAVIALIAFYEKYAGRLHRFLNGDGLRQPSRIVSVIKVIWIYMAGIVVSDLVASLATLPFAIYHFNRIAVYTSLGNFLAGPIIGLVIMPFMLLAMLLMPFGLDYLPLKLVGWGVSQVNQITAYVSGLPNAGYQVLAMPLWGLLLIVFGGLWLCLWNLSWRRWGWIGIVLGFLSILTVKVPDVMINADAKLIAVKDNQGRLIILPSRGNYFDKQIWLERTASEKLPPREYEKLRKIYQGKKTDKDWIDLICDKKKCLYKGRFAYLKNKGLEVDGKAFDTQESLGANFYLKEDKIRIDTIRGNIGYRLWN